MPRANSGTIRMLVHSLVNSIHNEAFACYTDLHNSVIAAEDSTLGPVHRLGSVYLCGPTQDVCVDPNRRHVGRVQGLGSITANPMRFLRGEQECGPAHCERGKTYQRSVPASTL